MMEVCLIACEEILFALLLANHELILTLVLDLVTVTSDLELKEAISVALKQNSISPVLRLSIVGNYHYYSHYCAYSSNFVVCGCIQV
jgi:hypothetical protein